MKKIPMKEMILLQVEYGKSKHGGVNELDHSSRLAIFLKLDEMIRILTMQTFTIKNFLFNTR